VTTAGLAYGVSCVSNNNPDTTCPTYCQGVAKTCEGGATQYKSNEICLSLCGVMDEAGVACRNQQIQLAIEATDPTVYYNTCHAAGPTSPLCPGPDPCTGFCQLAMAACGSLDNYADMNACMSACMTWDAGFTGDLTASPKGNNLECRTYHLELSQDQTTPGALMVHCPHTGLNSVVCQDPDAGSGDGGTDAPPG
jgi:hypothetical protein